MDNEKILVTGGTGFIGSKLVERLASKHYVPVVFDNNFRGSKERLRPLKGKIELIEGDIRNKDEVKKAAEKCSVIFHLAFINGTRYFYEQPELVLEVGVKGALNTLEAALENNIDKYILASSSEVYQEPTQVPTAEIERILVPDVKNPRYSYSGGKIISELLTINYLRKTSIKHHIFRPHNVFGPQMGFDHVIPELMKKVFIATEGWEKKECEIKIQGTGGESRAFCFVDDAVDQIMIVFEKGKSGEIYHIGIDEERTIRELIEDISRLLNIQIKIIPGELPEGGTSGRCPSIGKVCSLGYVKKNRYAEGLKKTVTWYKNYYNKHL
jgi:UDP-glucose 4-epimerase